ncbi:C40 family peptidase [Catelliglobosispora koreensis]|uniref:C40 family peptidase n=1 Tax=Catelliglobosispora koreensis TaxID=129052 RepID=UPI00037C3DC0|nr:C40 family peptidase [Catelliglobosispora koreensis]
MFKTLRMLLPVGVICATILGSAAVAHAEPTVAEVEKQISAKSEELEKVVEQYNMINEQLAATRAEIAKLQETLGPLEQQAGQARGRVTEIAQTAYRGAGVSGVGAVLSSGDAHTALQRLGALNQLASAQNEHIYAAQAAASKFAGTRKALEEQQSIEDGRAKTLEAQKQGIEAELSKLNELKIKVRGSATTSGSSYNGPIPSIPGSAGVAVTFAYNAIGTPYVWAASGPNGYDCSGLTLAAWRAAGVSLSHNAAQQWNQTAHIGRSDLAPGDLVFYSGLGHVGLYVGDGKVIHAPTFGDVVKISNVDMMTPYGYGRVRT